MARANRRRLFRLPRRADQQPGAERVSIPRPRSLASAAMSAQPKSKNAMDAHDKPGPRVPPLATSPASLAKCALCRQTPEVGAECPNWARSDLCGGRSAMGVPTANAHKGPSQTGDSHAYPYLIDYSQWSRYKLAVMSDKPALSPEKEGRLARVMGVASLVRDIGVILGFPVLLTIGVKLYDLRTKGLEAQIKA